MISSYTILESERPAKTCRRCDCDMTEKSDYFVEKYGLIHKMRLCVDCFIFVNSLETYTIISSGVVAN